MSYNALEDTELYRDSLATVDKSGKRIWLNPKQPAGRFYNRRKWFTALYLLVFFLGPFLEYKGKPLFLFNVLDRKFILFGQLFLPQDIVLFGLATIIFFVFIILFTVVFGRIWCGWLCPQTVFMEMIFRPIEYLIEGDGRAQKKLNEGPMTSEKVLKKTLKHLVFIVISIVFAHFVMAYIVGKDQVIQMVKSGPQAHWATFIGLSFFTFVFYYVFARLREQVCIAICPYGRLQAVLVNENTSAIMYDYRRGEPREHYKKGQAHIGGDCIDCNLCVQVCPTGIDIRNGVQLECTNCTACIDACDNVMTKLERPIGLIRYTSKASVESGKPFKIGARAKAYTAVLLVLLGLEAYLLGSRSTIETTLLRVPGQLYQTLPDGRLSNLYNAQIVNKSFEDLLVHLEPVDKTSEIKMVDATQKEVKIPKGEKAELVFFVIAQNNHQLKTAIKINVVSKNGVLETVKTNFMGEAAP